MKKILAILLAIVMVIAAFSVLPFSAVADNPLSLNCADGTTIKTGQKKISILVLGRPGCFYTRQTLSNIASSALINSDDIDLFFVDIDGNDQETILQFSNEFNCSKIRFCYDTAGVVLSKYAFYFEVYSFTLPLIVYLDAFSNPYGYTEGPMTAGEIAEIIAGFDGTGAERMPENITVELPVVFCQTEARKVFDMVNQFRTGGNAWYWNENNTEKIRIENLSALSYDYDLEKAAMQRAAELALNYSHTRPDGSSCFTAYNYRTAGENIAVWYMSAAEVNDAWREDDEDYSGQGHRRNMLNTVITAMAVGCVYYNGWYFWAEEFRSPVVGSKATPAVDGEETVDIELSDSLFDAEFQFDSAALELEQDTTLKMPTGKANFDSQFGDVTSLTAKLNWQSENPDIAYVKDGILYGVSPGKTTFTGMAFDKEIIVSVNVLAHIWDSGTITAAPTCTKSGEKTFTCIRNPSHTYTEIIPATGHNNVWKITKLATKVETGIKEEMCSVCGEKTGNSQTISYTGHITGDINGDNKVNNKDLVRLFQYLSKWQVEVNAEALDVNGDKKINNKDLVRLFQYLSKWAVEIF